MDHLFPMLAGFVKRLTFLEGINIVYVQGSVSAGSLDVSGSDSDRHSSDTVIHHPEQQESYYDALNLWLSETLKREVRHTLFSEWV